MTSQRDAITEYMLELLDELHLPGGRRRRILIEVGDHLATAAAELHAGGLAPDAAEREAVRRFGDAQALARTFLEQEVARAGWRAARATALLVVPLLLLVGPLGRIAASGAPGQGIVAFVLAQVALAAGGVTVVRACRLREPAGLAGRLGLVLRGSAVVCGCTWAIVVTNFVAAGADWTGPVWTSRGLLGAWAAVTAVIAARTRRWARRAGVIVPGRADAVASDLLGDTRAAAALALSTLARRIPPLAGAADAAGRLLVPAAAQPPGRAPGLARWVDLRRHPWRFATATALAAGLMLAAVHAVAEGAPSPHHLVGAIVAAVVIVAIEAIAVLAGFGVLGHFLGLRATADADDPYPDA